MSRNVVHVQIVTILAGFLILARFYAVYHLGEGLTRTPRVERGGPPGPKEQGGRPSAAALLASGHAAAHVDEDCAKLASNETVDEEVDG